MFQREKWKTTAMSKRSTKFYKKNEAEVMRRLGFNPTPNSGAGWLIKEDGDNEQAICQLKSTDKQSISIKQNDLHILEKHALESHKLPVFAIQFLNLDEVWIMVKPEHIELLQSLVRGDDISENLPRNIFEENTQNSIDKTEEKDYNNSVTNKGDIKSRLIAKRKYAEKVDKEREEREKEQKRRAKQWKQRLNKKE